MVMITQNVSATVNFTLTGQYAYHVSYGVSLAVTVDLGNSILLRILVMLAQEHLLYHSMLHLITPTLAWIVVTVYVSHVTRILQEIRTIQKILYLDGQKLEMRYTTNKYILNTVSSVAVVCVNANK